MLSYLVTGASRGLGLSSNPANIIVGLVRDKAATEAKVASELPDRKNIHILQGDLTDYESLKQAVVDTSAITSRKLDYLIANAGLQGTWTHYDSIGDLDAQSPLEFHQNLLDMFTTNVIGNIHLFTLFTPLIRAGTAKKVVAISTGLADAELAAKFNLNVAAPYSISKVALNMAVAKFSAQWAKEGVLFMTVAPGGVDTGVFNEANEEQQQKLGAMMGSFMKYAPHFAGPTPIDVAVGQMIGVWEKASVEGGDGGTSVSQFGNKQWL